jgi:hypothetical protein
MESRLKKENESFKRQVGFYKEQLKTDLNSARKGDSFNFSSLMSPTPKHRKIMNTINFGPGSSKNKNNSSKGVYSTINEINNAYLENEVDDQQNGKKQNGGDDNYFSIVTLTDEYTGAGNKNYLNSSVPYSNTMNTEGSIAQQRGVLFNTGIKAKNNVLNSSTFKRKRNASTMDRPDSNYASIEKNRQTHKKNNSTIPASHLKKSERICNSIKSNIKISQQSNFCSPSMTPFESIYKHHSFNKQ